MVDDEVLCGFAGRGVNSPAAAQVGPPNAGTSRTEPIHQSGLGRPFAATYPKKMSAATATSPMTPST